MRRRAAIAGKMRVITQTSRPCAHEYYTTRVDNATLARLAIRADAGTEIGMRLAHAQAGKAGAHRGLGADRRMVDEDMTGRRAQTARSWRAGQCLCCKSGARSAHDQGID